MQINDYDNQQVLTLIKEANDIAVVPSKVAGADAFCASVGLYLMLKERFASATNKDKKNVKFLFAGNVPETCEGLLAQEEMTTNIQDRELMISVDYSGTNAAKVQYTTENDILYLKLGPIPKHFDINRIKSKITGFDFDLVFVVGAQELADLGAIYNNLRSEINKAKKVNIDIAKRNSKFGIINIIDDTADSLSTLIFKNAAAWEISPNKNAAKALLTGISQQNHRIVD